MITIKGIAVDVDALTRLGYRCDPGLCREGACCCKIYDVAVTGREMERAIGMMPGCSAFARHLRDGDVFDNPFEPLGGNLYRLDEDDDGLCVFAYHGAEGETWCSLHSAALEAGLSPWDVKPECCTLWPLALSSGRPRVLGVQADAFNYPCIRRRRRTCKGLDPGVAAAVAASFGEDFLMKLKDAMRV